MLESASAALQCFHHAPMHQNATNRLITTAKALRDHLNIGRNAFLFPGMQGTGATHAGHHLIQNQQSAMAITDSAHGLEIAGQRGRATKRGSHHRFRAKGDHIARAKALEFRLKLRRQPRDVISIVFIFAPIAIGEAGGDMAEGIRQDRRVRRAPRDIATGRKRAQRIAMIGLAPRDKARALRFACFQKILPRDFECGFHPLTT